MTPARTPIEGTPLSVAILYVSAGVIAITINDDTTNMSITEIMFAPVILNDIYRDNAFSSIEYWVAKIIGPELLSECSYDYDSIIENYFMSIDPEIRDQLRFHL